jgi:glucosamine-6-phosphate deaminase
MEFKVFKSHDELYRTMCEDLISCITKTPKQVVLGLATGSSPIPLYQLLINSKLDFSNVKTFNLDEYVGLEKNHQESYHSFMTKHLFSHINIKPENVHIPDYIDANSCRDYEELLKLNTIDYQVLGIGSNGHIGFNEPLTPFDSTTHVVTLSDKTRFDNARFFANDINSVPKQAITMVIKTILRAKKIGLIAIGSGKREAIAKLKAGLIDLVCPATALLTHPDVTIYVDEEAYY